MKNVSKTTYLVFALISIVVGALISLWCLFVIISALAFEAQYPGFGMAPGAYFVLYIWLSVGIVLILVGILLFILRARRTE